MPNQKHMSLEDRNYIEQALIYFYFQKAKNKPTKSTYIL